MLIGEAPGLQEEKASKTFIGEIGELIKKNAAMQ